MVTNIYEMVKNRRKAIEEVIQKNYGAFPDEFMKQVFLQRDCLDSQIRLLEPYVKAINDAEKNKKKVE